MAGRCGGEIEDATGTDATETKNLLVKQIQQGVKDALQPNKDFLSASGLKK
jgi:hypothetical protein